MKIRLLFLFLVVVIFVFACKKDKKSIETSDPKSQENTMDSLEIDEDFNFETTQVLTISGSVKAGNGKGISKVPIKIYDKDTILGGELILQGQTDNLGQYKFSLNLASHRKELFIMAKYVGFLNSKTIPISGNNINVDFGGKSVSKSKHTNGSKNKFLRASGYSYLGGYNYLGVPDYLLT